MRTTLKTLRLTIVGFILATCALVAPAPAAQAAQQCVGISSGGTVSYQGDCVFMNVYTAYDGRIIVQYWGNKNFDFYQLRWSRPGRAETQSVVRGSGSAGSWWALTGAWDGTPYTFKVQACYSRFLGSSDCTSWSSVTYYKWGPSRRG